MTAEADDPIPSLPPEAIWSRISTYLYRHPLLLLTPPPPWLGVIYLGALLAREIGVVVTGMKVPRRCGIGEQHPAGNLLHQRRDYRADFYLVEGYIAFHPARLYKYD